MVVSKKPDSFVCSDCGKTTEPIRVPFKDDYWIAIKHCPACEEKQMKSQEQAEVLQTIDRIASDVDGVLVSRGITPKLLQARIEKVPEKLQQLLDISDGAFIYGPPGTGKSFLLAAVLRKAAMDAIEHARRVVGALTFRTLPYFVNVNDLMQRLRLASLGKNENGEDDASIIRLYTNYPVLLLDDIGVRRSTQFMEDCLYEIINTREQYLRPTFFTSNYSLKELAARIEPRTVSRIAGITAKHVIFLGGSDRRLLTGI
jgi:DNA replication protein DnaC